MSSHLLTSTVYVCAHPQRHAKLANKLRSKIARHSRVKVEYAGDAGSQALLCRRAGFAEGSRDVVSGPFVPILPAPTCPDLPPQPASPTVDYTDDDVQMAQAVAPQEEQLGLEEVAAWPDLPTIPEDLSLGSESPCLRGIDARIRVVARIQARLRR